jgi:methyl-accepting chemotaxis protein
MHFNDLKIGIKLILAMTLLVISIIVIISVVINSKVQQIVENDAKAIAEETAYHYSHVIKAFLEEPLNEAKALADVFETLATVTEVNLSRYKINIILKNFIEKNKDFFAASVLFEPNAYDNKDKNFINEWGHDKTGRFIPYWTRDAQGIGVLEPLVNYEIEGKDKGDYYLLPKKSKKECILNPFIYPVQGQEVLLTTFSIPMFNQQGDFIGITGIDLSLEQLQNLVQNIKIANFKNAYVNFYAADGSVVASDNADYLGKPVTETAGSQTFIDNILKGEAFFIKRTSRTLNGQEVMTYGAPVEIGRTGAHWMVAVTIPENELMLAAQQIVTLIVTIGIIAVLMAILIIYLFAKTISNPLNKLIKIFESIAAGNLNNEIHQQGQDEVGQLLSAFARMQTQLRTRIEEDKQIANEALRINEALNNVGTSVLIADMQYKVIYANSAAQRLFKERQAEIHQDLPKLDVDHLVGCPIDVFHKDPPKARQLINHLTTTHHTLLEVDSLSVDMHITPVINAEGQRLGWVAEFNDRTAEVIIEQEINTVMSAASQGDFSRRLQLDDKKGFFKALSEVLNQTLNDNQQMIDELMHVFSAIAQGDLSQTITKDYSGTLAQLKNDVNITINKLTAVIAAIQAVADAASQGDFNQRIELADNTGFFKTLSDSLNHMLALNQQIIEELMRVFGAVVQGDLTQKISRDYIGSLEQVKNDVNATLLKLISVINIIQQTADAVNIAASEISRGNLNLSQRTEEQAASLEQTAASMEQMTGTVQQNTDHTRQAATLATNAREQAIQGGKVVNDVVIAIDKINKSSKQVADIIGVIDDIAFQTNLLALNAAVEAARAGEQGRGFAVVATEVRNLAQRSAEAAKEIKALIQDSVDRVVEGTQLVSQSGHVLEDIVTAVKRVSDIISEIASASQEQTSGIHQVNKAIAQMEEMTQQNAALVEESAAASESMKKQAEHLKNHIAFFKTDETL